MLHCRHDNIHLIASHQNRHLIKITCNHSSRSSLSTVNNFIFCLIYVLASLLSLTCRLYIAYLTTNYHRSTISYYSHIHTHTHTQPYRPVERVCTCCVPLRGSWSCCHCSSHHHCYSSPSVYLHPPLLLLLLYPGCCAVVQSVLHRHPPNLPLRETLSLPRRPINSHTPLQTSL